MNAPRATQNALKPDGKALAADKRSTTKGDVPQALLDRYLVERDVQGRAERFFRDHRSPAPSFIDKGRSLNTPGAYPDAVADMLRIAEHRNWSRVRVEGDEAFRREAWIQARAKGLEVQGYKPRTRDRQAAGVPPLPNLEDRVRRVALVVRSVVADPAVQARLIAYARSRAGLERERGGSRHRERS